MIGGNKIKIIGVYSGQYKNGNNFYKVAFSTKMHDTYAPSCDEADTTDVDKDIYDYLTSKKVGDIVTGSVSRENFRLKIKAIFD